MANCEKADAEVSFLSLFELFKESPQPSTHELANDVPGFLLVEYTIDSATRECVRRGRRARREGKVVLVK